MVVEELLCDTQERNDIHNKNKNNITKDDKFISLHHFFLTYIRIWKTLLHGYLKGLHGITYLVNPKNYRPTTYLSTTYKLLLSIITGRIYVFMETNDLFPIEQKGCRRGFYGCKDQLLINWMMIKDCKSKYRNLNITWIHYRKAHDSVPHSWIWNVFDLFRAFDTVPHSRILKVLDLCKISPVLINFLRINMSMWGTTLNLTHQNGNLKSKPTEINSGVFQSDSLSLLLFVYPYYPCQKN